MGKKYLLEIEENKDGGFAWSNFAPYTEPDLEQIRNEAYSKGHNDGLKVGYEKLKAVESERIDKAYKRGYEDAKHECEDCTKNGDFDAIRKEEYYKGFQAGSANTSLVITDNTIRERIEEAYQQGLEDSRNQKATCEFCEYAGNDESNEPCVSCCCGYMNRFRPKKEEIQIGDEVKFYNGEKCVVTVVENGQVLEVMDKDGFSMEMDDGLRNSMDKTGRHFNELGKLLQKMKEDDGDLGHGRIHN